MIRHDAGSAWQGSERNGETMGTKIRFAMWVIVGVLLFLIDGPAAWTQNAEPFKFFREYVGLNQDQIAAIQSGKAIAKVLDSRSPDEVFVFGSVYVKSTPENYLKLASDADALRKLPNYLAIQKFSDPPQLSDLAGFTLEAEDIKQLKNCESGRCEVQLPTEAMDSFKQSVDWSAPDVAKPLGERIQELIAFGGIHRVHDCRDLGSRQ